MSCHGIQSSAKFAYITSLFHVAAKGCAGSAPSYLRELVVVKENRYRLRSSNQLLLSMPKGITKKTLGDRVFAVAAPRLCNSLPEELQSKSDINDFKRHLKAHFFTKAFSTP